MSQTKPNIYKSNQCPPCPPNASTFDKCIYWLGIGLGSGLPRRAAGTWGTLGGLVIALPLIWAGFWVFLGATLIGLIVGSFICSKTSALMGIEDDPHIVFDEWVGLWLTLLPTLFVLYEFGQLGEFLPNTLLFWIVISLGFGLFRLFDVLKPAPISWADKHVSGGFGIMLDDVLAGVIAGMIMVIVIFSFVPFGQ